jgi:hypothetical protein
LRSCQVIQHILSVAVAVKSTAAARRKRVRTKQIAKTLPKSIGLFNCPGGGWAHSDWKKREKYGEIN